MPLSITCVICARNELQNLRGLLPYLANEDIEVVLIDNDSTDGTAEEITSSAHPNLIDLRRFPFDGAFDLGAQLAAKADVMAKLRSDWVIHQDADEILQGARAWGGLRACLEQADAERFNVVNFDEYVMLPFDPAIDDPWVNNRLCYFFEPHPQRLMRAWRRCSGLSNLGAGGHTLQGGDILVSPARPLLKHFIVRSQAHALSKYLGRTFATGDLERGWHGNRVGLTEAALTLPKLDDPRLTWLDSPIMTPDQPLAPIARHFWEWPALEAAESRAGHRGVSCSTI